MLSNDRPFPLEALRDLLGLVRAMHAAARERQAGALVLARIERVGRELAAAYALAAESGPGTIGERAAWTKAERATRAVADLVELTDPAEPIIAAACARVRRRRT